MRLYIAEKPSMAAEIAKCLLNPIRKEGYFETADGVVTWAVGHILQQADPVEYDEKYKKWRMEDLPIIPVQWKLNITPSCIRQFKVIERLVREASEIVHAGDPDREGQLLIDEILEYLRNNKPVKRLLLNALDERSIKQALANLKNNEDFFTLQQSALARSRADWLMGMNLSRAYTITAQRAGHEGVLPVGRVKTPTLSLVVRREEEIKNFKSMKYYLLKVRFQHKNGTFQTMWQPKDTQAGLDSEGRVADREIVDNVVEKCRAEKNPAVISNCEKTQKREVHRLPYSLSALQVEAGRRFGYSPQMVLDTAQRLYEAKLITYPRSDCEFLPENQFEDAPDVMVNLKEMGQQKLGQWVEGVDTALKSRAWNDKKITAHHAIIPTVQVCEYEKLTLIEQKIYFLIAQSYIAQFYPLHVYDCTKITVEYSEERFTATARTIVEEGWHSVFPRMKEEEHADEGESDEADRLPMVEVKDIVGYVGSVRLDKATRPPSRFTSSTLLQAMKEIYKFVKNPDLKKQLKEVKGIGTEATRASIIKEIIERGLLMEDKKSLIPTDQAYLLVYLLPEELTYPDSTAQWEMTFEKMVDGSVKLCEFMDRQTQFISSLCQKAKSIEVEQAKGQACPLCHKGMLRQKKSKDKVFWGCNAYPECKAAYADKKGKPDLEPPKTCPQCGKGVLRLKDGKNGKFWSCSSYPECKTSFADHRGKPVIAQCPACKKGLLGKRSGTKGDFWGCSNYPNCKAAFKDNKGKPDLPKKGGKTHG
jgi:DNA topoisomerase-3